MSTKRKTNNEFIQEAIGIHGDKYDYSKVEYINQHTKVCIICPKHGEFWQKPKVHLCGKGCPKCGIEKCVSNKKITKLNQPIKEKIHFTKCNHISQENCLARFRLIHGDKYDYSKVEYINQNTKVCIICPKHGEFWQAPQSHWCGAGCKKCNPQGSKRSTVEFIQKAKDKHGDKYDYSKVEYINQHTKVCIICPKHGEFWQKPIYHLNTKHGGCHLCDLEYKRNLYADDTSTFIKKACNVHGKKYNYENVKYINNKTKVEVFCPKHGFFWVMPQNHLKGKGCPMCATERYTYENNVFCILKEIFDEKDIVRQYHNKELLGKLSLDFYIPKFKLGVEHQGSQHFKAQKFLGGKEKFKRLQENDKLKFKIAKEAGITILYYTCEPYAAPKVYFSEIYKDSMTFQNKIKDYIKHYNNE